MHINILLIESLLLLLYNHGEIQIQATGRSENKKTVLCKFFKAANRF